VCVVFRIMIIIKSHNDLLFGESNDEKQPTNAGPNIAKKYRDAITL